MNNREIKFRAWSPSQNDWLSSTDGEARIQFYESRFEVRTFHESVIVQGGEPTEVETWEDHEDAIIMQYTGLKDKNDKEIYEFDVLENPQGKKGLVVYYDGCFRIQTHKSNTSSHYITLNQGYCDNKIIIGNQFQNPELL